MCKLIVNYIKCRIANRGQASQKNPYYSLIANSCAFGGEAGTDNAWLIMDPFDASSFADIVINFDVQSFYDGPGDLNVFNSIDYSGSGCGS